MRTACLPALLCLLALASPAMAGTVYKCTDARGHVTYRDTPCAAGDRQQVVHLDAAAPAPPASIPVATPPPAPPSPPVAPPATAPRTSPAPSVVLYRCRRATDDGTYLSRTGQPPPYWVPGSMLSWQRPLAEIYGSGQGTGVGLSAPELMPEPTSRMIGSGYVLVRDICRRLPPRVACDALRKQYEANEEAIDRAFESDRAPLRQRRGQLRAQMAGCR